MISENRKQMNVAIKKILIIIIIICIVVFFLIGTLIFLNPQKIECGQYDGACYADRCFGKTVSDDGMIRYGIHTACNGICYGYKYNKCEKSYVPILILKKIVSKKN